VIALSIAVAGIFILLIATWLVGPFVRESLTERRRFQAIEAQLLAEERIRVVTNTTLAAMRAAVRRHEVGGQ
jgi:hypothetical protein